MDTNTDKQTAAFIALHEECERLRAALATIAKGDSPRPVILPWRIDGRPSKHDQCAHSKFMYETCGDCIEDFAVDALTKHGAGS